MQHGQENISAQTAALDFARRTIPFWQAALGSELLGVYLIGSLAHGGFSRRYSDIDIAVVTRAGLSPQTLDRVRSEAAAVSVEWAAKLSVFWTDRYFGLGRFPLLDRVDYLDHAVVLIERERVQPVRPALEEIRHYLRGAPFANWTEQARRSATAETLEPKDRKAFLRTLLYPGRFCYSWMTGCMGSNDDAVAFLAKTRPSSTGRELDRPCAAMSAGRCRPRRSFSRANDVAVAGGCLRRAFDRGNSLELVLLSQRGAHRFDGNDVARCPLCSLSVQVRRRNELTRCANRDLMRRSKSSAIRSPRRGGQAAGAAPGF